MFSWAPDYCCSLNISGVSILQLRTMLGALGRLRLKMLESALLLSLLLLLLLLQLGCRWFVHSSIKNEGNGMHPSISFLFLG